MTPAAISAGSSRRKAAGGVAGTPPPTPPSEVARAPAPSSLIAMSRQFYFFDQPRRFVVGTVGQPGERTFFLQASDDGRVVNVALEKSQVLVLAERMEQLLEE